MNTNPINATLLTADQEAITAAVNTIKQKLPFLIDLTSDDRQAIVKLGDKSQAFLKKALDVAALNPGVLPVSFDLTEMRNNAQLYADLSSIGLALRSCTNRSKIRRCTLAVRPTARRVPCTPVPKAALPARPCKPWPESSESGSGGDTPLPRPRLPKPQPRHSPQRQRHKACRPAATDIRNRLFVAASVSPLLEAQRTPVSSSAQLLTSVDGLPRCNGKVGTCSGERRTLAREGRNVRKRRFDLRSRASGLGV